MPAKCARTALLAVAVAIALLCLGCSDDVRQLTTWTRIAPAPAPSAVTLPGEVRQDATIEDARATIETVVAIAPEWRGKPPRLSPTADGDDWYRFVRGATFHASSSVTPVLAFLALLYLVLFALDRRRPAHGWFALQALVVAALVARCLSARPESRPTAQECVAALQ